MDAEDLANLINSGILLATIGGLAAVTYELREGKKSQIAQNRRQRISETFAFYENFRREISEENRMLVEGLEVASGEEISMQVPLSGSQVMILLNPDNKAVRVHAINALRLYERLAVGVSSGLYDFDVIYQLSRSEISGKFGFYAAYIQDVRYNKAKTAYSDFIDLVKLIVDRADRSGEQFGNAYVAAQEQGLIPIK